MDGKPEWIYVFNTSCNNKIFKCIYAIYGKYYWCFSGAHYYFGVWNNDIFCSFIFQKKGEKAMIYTTIMGGLGNQMFQYAAARSLSLQTGQKISLDFRSMDLDTVRKYSLDCCNIPQDVMVQDPVVEPKWNRDFNIWLKCALKFAPEMTRKYLEKRNVFYDRESCFHELNPDRNCPDIYLYGYWQSEKYFFQYRDILKKELQVKISERAGVIANQIRNDQNAVCVHYRKTDYKISQNRKYQVCSTKYYLNAIQKMRTLLPAPQFYIFSDEIDEVKAELGMDDDFHFMERSETDIDDFGLMCNCSHFIISNSSFSWWAQYLSESNNKIVIAPQKWTADDTNRDIYLEDWILMDGFGKSSL